MNKTAEAIGELIVNEIGGKKNVKPKSASELKQRHIEETYIPIRQRAEILKDLRLT